MPDPGKPRRGCFASGLPGTPAGGDPRPPAGVLLAGRTAAVEPAHEWLTPAERARAAALVRAADRADYVAAHVLARRCAALLLGADPQRLTLVQHCPTCGGTGHGRPALAEEPQVRLSLAHTAGYVAAAAGPAEVGVDVEGVPAADRVELLSDAVLGPAELAALRAAADPGATFARIWVRKEALVKLGLADLDGLAGLDVSGALADTASWQGYQVLGWTAPGVVGALVARRAPALVQFLG